MNRKGAETQSFKNLFSLRLGVSAVKEFANKLLIGIYLLFFDKKDLTNGIDWFIPCAMNVTAPMLIPAFLLIYLVCQLYARKTANDKLARLARIRNASFIIRLLIYLGLILQVYMLLAFIFGWPPPYNDNLRIVISQHHIYASPAEMPQEILALWLVKNGLGIFCAVVLICLFRLYEKGILFSAKNVRYLRFLGYYLMIDWVIDYLMQGQLQDMDLSTTPLFSGFLIIFIAWIMDEGRKIQEEQELTV